MNHPLRAFSPSALPTGKIVGLTYDVPDLIIKPKVDIMPTVFPIPVVNENIKVTFNYLDKFLQAGIRKKIFTLENRVKAVAVPYSTGTVIELAHADNPEMPTPIQIEKPVSTANEALHYFQVNIAEFLPETYKQEQGKVDVNDFCFEGTNIFYDTEKIYIIKQNIAEEWTDNASEHDIERIGREVYELRHAG